jgi:tetratricopeptide (TPR) repeat protein
VWREWRPKGGGSRVLITSRRQHWTATSGVEPLQLQPLGRRASQELLLSPRAKGKKSTPAALLADPATAAEADAICEALGDLPLALALAGAYLETTPSASLTRYRADIETAPLARLATTLDEPLPTGHEASILKTFALSYDKLDANTPDDALARTILHRAACLAPAPIPRHLLLRAAGLDPADAYAQEQADHALRRLATLGLIEELGDEGVRLHRLLAAYARLRAATPAEDSAAVEAALFNELDAINASGYPLVGLPYLPHLHSTAAVADARGDKTAATLLNSLGYLLKAQGNLVGAKRYYERALVICEKILGPGHPNTATSLNNLGLLVETQGDLTAARIFCERALAIREQALGSYHPDTAGSLNNLGGVLKEEGDLAAARAYSERALSIYEQTHGPWHPNTATVLNNLGSLLQAQGDLTGAFVYLDRALVIDEMNYGQNHPNLATDLNNLGSLMKIQGDLARARPYLERALEICEQSLGPNHPDTARGLNNLGNLLQAQGDFVGAQSYLERALAISERTLGPTHPNTVHSLNNLAQLHYHRGEFAAALALLERALSVREKTLGADHPDTCDIRVGQDLVRQALSSSQ